MNVGFDKVFLGIAGTTLVFTILKYFGNDLSFYATSFAFVIVSLIIAYTTKGQNEKKEKDKK